MEPARAETHGGDSADAAEERRRLAAVLDAFGVGGVAAMRAVAEGLMNRNWAVTTTAGRQVFVKQVLDVAPDRARRQHAATRSLAQVGLPVAAPLATGDDQTLLESDGGWWAVYPWVDGHTVHGTDLTIHQAQRLGEVLAGIHQGLADALEAGPSAMPMTVKDSAQVKHVFDDLSALIAAREMPDAFDALAAEELKRRRALLESVEHLRPDASTLWRPTGWVHGDFHDLNVLWDDSEELAAVVDFDRIAVKPYAFELVRSATLMFGHGDERGLDLARVAAFVGGYRRVAPIGAQALRMALHRLWWERIGDVWHLKRHYQPGGVLDCSCDHLFRSASALLWWWTDHRAEVEDAVTTR